MKSTSCESPRDRKRNNNLRAKFASWQSGQGSKVTSPYVTYHVAGSRPGTSSNSIPFSNRTRGGSARSQHWQSSPSHVRSPNVKSSRANSSSNANDSKSEPPLKKQKILAAPVMSRDEPASTKRSAAAERLSNKLSESLPGIRTDLKPSHHSSSRSRKMGSYQNRTTATTPRLPGTRTTQTHSPTSTSVLLTNKNKAKPQNKRTRSPTHDKYDENKPHNMHTYHPRSSQNTKNSKETDKTRSCQYHATYGNCKFGSNCCFEHAKKTGPPCIRGDVEINTYMVGGKEYMPYKDCKFWSSGFCNFGSNCRFLHEPSKQFSTQSRRPHTAAAVATSKKEDIATDYSNYYDMLDSPSPTLSVSPSPTGPLPARAAASMTSAVEHTQDFNSNSSSFSMQLPSPAKDSQIKSPQSFNEVKQGSSEKKQRISASAMSCSSSFHSSSSSLLSSSSSFSTSTTSSSSSVFSTSLSLPKKSSRTSAHISPSPLDEQASKTQLRHKRDDHSSSGIGEAVDQHGNRCAPQPQPEAFTMHKNTIASRSDQGNLCNESIEPITKPPSRSAKMTDHSASALRRGIQASAPTPTRHSSKSSEDSDDEVVMGEIIYSNRKQKDATIPGAPVGQWSCGQCTLFNPIRNHKCQACSTSRPSPSRRSRKAAIRQSIDLTSEPSSPRAIRINAAKAQAATGRLHASSHNAGVTLGDLATNTGSNGHLKPTPKLRSKPQAKRHPVRLANLATADKQNNKKPVTKKLTAKQLVDQHQAKLAQRNGGHGAFRAKKRAFQPNLKSSVRDRAATKNKGDQSSATSQHPPFANNTSSANPESSSSGSFSSGSSGSGTGFGKRTRASGKVPLTSAPVEDSVNEQQRLFREAARRRKLLQSKQGKFPSSKHGHGGNLHLPGILPHQIPAFFREKSVNRPYTASEREQAARMLLSHEQRPVSSLCLPRLKDASCKYQQALVKTHYKKLALLVHPDKVKAAGANQNKHGNKGSGGLNSAMFAKAFSILNKAKDLVLKTRCE